jgi:fatty-acyl-CoA synthase
VAPKVNLHRDMTLGQALAQVAETFPRREALVSDTTRITFAELDRRVEGLARGLAGLDLARGDRLAVILPNSPEFVYAFFAAARAGLVIIPINPLYRRGELRHILSDAAAAAVLTVPTCWGNDLLDILRGLRPELPSLRHIVVAGTASGQDVVSLAEVMAGPTDGPRLDRAAASDLFGLIYTSGTTGMPKGTMHSHRSMLAPVIAGERLYEELFGKPSLERLSRFFHVVASHAGRFVRWAGKQLTHLTPSPFHAMTGYGLMLNTVLFGNRLALLDRFHPLRTLEIIDREQVNVFVGTPTMYAMMLQMADLARYDLSSLLLAVMGAAPCPPDLVRQVRERFGCPVMIGFGATEIAGGALTTRLDDPEDKGAETVGRPFPDAEIRVVDEQRRQVPRGQVGELACRTDGVMLGYYHAPDATAAALDEEGWYYTGDLAVMDDKGYVRIVGRKKDMIIRGGQNIFPVEIENRLVAHPHIKHVAVVGVPTRDGDERVWAFIVPRDGVQPDATDVLEFCRRELAVYKVPDEIRFVAELPFTATGKVQKFALRQQALHELGDEELGRQWLTD